MNDVCRFVLAPLLLAVGFDLFSGSTLPFASTAQAAIQPTAAPAQSAPLSPPAGPRKRTWDVQFLDQLYSTSPGATLQFELVAGELATGTLRHIQRTNGQVTYVAGQLSEPAPGRFFFQRQSLPGKAGAFVGVVELPSLNLAYRIEPTGPDQSAELVELPLSQVICQVLPPPDTAAIGQEEIPPLDPSDFPDYPIPDYQDGIIPLQSLPGASAVLYIDYRGGYTPTWGGITYAKPDVSNAQIRDVWKRVAEDYMPFNINVTTDIQVYEKAAPTSRQRCVVTPTTTAAPGAGGVAYIHSWNWDGDTPCWAFYSTGKSAAEVISHEVGHTLNLGHDGQNPDTGYYGGQGSGEVGWAPIMGVGYYRNVAQWSKGEYTDANNTQDDLVRIVSDNNSVDYRADDTGANLASARYLEVYSNNTAFAEGVIEQAGDIDAFRFTTKGGSLSLRGNVVGDWANLALEATLCNSMDVVIASNNPQTTLWAAINTTVAAGTYTFRLKGAGRNNPLTDGFSPYASLGYYSVSGTVTAGAVADRFTIAEHSPFGTVVGTVIPLSGTGPWSFAIASGNTSSAFSIDSSGVLRVANPTVLNYETLAVNRQLPVQYELFVNVNNLSNPSLNEVNRRVVVAIQDINDAPTATGLNLVMLEHTLPGTLLGTVKATDPDFYSLLNYSIVSGDTNKVFSIGRQSGELTVVADLEASAQNFYQLRIAAVDNGSLAVTSIVNVTVMPTQNPFNPGLVNYAQYRNIDGNLVSSLTAAPNFPTRPDLAQQLTSLEGPIDAADTFGSVMRGYLIPPTTGVYYFYVASDDNSELWMSTSTNPAAMARIAYISGDTSHTSPRQWNKYVTQRSGGRSLAAGSGYYFEVRHKEGGGGDHVAVGWTGPGITTTNVIPGLYVAPYELNYYPEVAGFSANLRRDLLQGARVDQLQITDYNAGQSFTCQILSGNEEGIFAVDNQGWVRVANAALLQSTPSTSFNLLVRVTDNASAPLSAEANVNLTLIEPGQMLAVGLQREMFLNIGNGTTIANLTSHAKFPRGVDRLDDITAFTTASGVADEFGSRVRAILTPPVSGSYRFFIASDDASQLKFSTTTNPASAVVIASVSGWTDPNNWNDEPGQTSALRPLVAGEQYYIEALHKEGGGGDHLSVAWVIPGSTETNIIDAAYLSPADISQAPLLTNQTLRVFSTAVNGAAIGQFYATDSPLETLAFQIVSGNTGNTFALDPDTGVLRVADNSLLAAGSVSSFALAIRVQDSGYQGLYPLRTTQATLTVLVQSANVPLAWSGLGDTNRWSDAGNWSGGALPWSGARLIFGAPVRQVNLNDAASILTSVQITNNGFEISGAPVRLQSGLTNAGNNTWNLNTTLSGSQTWNSSGGTLTVGGSISNGGYALGLTGSSDISLKGSVAGTGGLTKTGTARLLLGGVHSYTGTTTIQSAGGTTTALEVAGDFDLDLGTSDLTLNGRMDLFNHNARVGALNGAGLLFANNGARTLTVGANNHSGIFTGVLQDSTWASGVRLHLVKTGTGAQTLSGANTFSGDITVQQGTLSAANASALGSATGGTFVEQGATLNLANNINVSGERLTLAGTGVTEVGALRSSGVNTFGGPITLTAPAKLQVLSGILTLNGSWTTLNNTVQFDTFAGSGITVNSGISGNGGLIKSGPGSLTLRGVHTYAGPTTIESGILSVAAGAALPGTGPITVAAGATLNVTDSGVNWVLPASQTLYLEGAVTGPVTLNGVLSSGSNFVMMTCTSNVTLAGQTVLKLGRFGGSLSNDVLTCQGTLSIGGSLTLTNAGPDILAAGDAFTLLAAGSFGPGSFTSIVLPPLSTGLTWDSSTLSTDGVVRVAGPAGPAVPGLTFSTQGGMLQLAWPVGYSIEGQTNATTGIQPIWHPIQTTGNELAVPIDSTNASVFYRLIRN